MIVMTDGRANRTPNSYCDDDPARQWPGGSAAQDCVIYYAHEARENSIVVYTITLGGSADFELMAEVAELTGGVHRNADRPEKLNEIFEELYERIFLRLVD
jgi:Mg-chelatase subunit ChlD